jgi:hypothetical protein
MNTSFSFLFTSIFVAVVACNNAEVTASNTADPKKVDPEVIAEPAKAGLHFRAALKGGMKGDSLFFDVSADGKRIENLTFKGYWYCDGKLERENAAGPEGYFTVVDGKVDTHISEPPNGGATAWRFDLKATIDGKKASGTFRMNINALRCNTGTLSWGASAD